MANKETVPSKQVAWGQGKVGQTTQYNPTQFDKSKYSEETKRENTCCQSSWCLPQTPSGGWTLLFASEGHSSPDLWRRHVVLPHRLRLQTNKTIRHSGTSIPQSGIEGDCRRGKRTTVAWKAVMLFVVRQTWTDWKRRKDMSCALWGCWHVLDKAGEEWCHRRTKIMGTALPNFHCPTSHRSLPAPRRRRGLVCRRQEMRCWASPGSASSPSGHNMSSESSKTKTGYGYLVEVRTEEESAFMQMWFQ